MKILPTDKKHLEKNFIAGFLMLLSVIALATFARTLQRHQAVKIMEQITQLSDNLRVLYLNFNNYRGISNTQAVSLEAVPPSLITKQPGILRHAFRGQVYINPTPKYIDSDQMALEIAFDGLTREACIVIATSTLPQAGLLSMMVRGMRSEASIWHASSVVAEQRQVGCSGSLTILPNGTGQAVACPDGLITMPLSKSQADLACNCVGPLRHQCSITWEYF